MTQVVVSYWSGKLPEITFLHFLSVRTLNPDLRYVLYLECDPNFVGSTGPDLDARLRSLGIEIKRVSLNELLLKSGVPRFSKWREIRSYRLFRKVIRRLIPVISALLPKASTYKIDKSDLLNWVVSHNFPFSGYSHDRAYRSDLFRSLIFQEYSDCDYLYLDLDICLIRKLEFNSFPDGAIAPWGTSKSGNSAYLLLPRSALSAKAKILKSLQAGHSALPWVLYSETRIRDYNLHLHESREIDPAWSVESVIHADTTLFFRSGDHVSKFISEVDDNCIGVHWHNQWSVIPENGSPYEILKDRFLNLIEKPAG